MLTHVVKFTTVFPRMKQRTPTKPKAPLQVRLGDEDREKIKRMADENGISMNAAMTILLRSVLMAPNPRLVVQGGEDDEAAAA